MPTALGQIQLGALEGQAIGLVVKLPCASGIASLSARQ
jgi:hypothetical protein